MKLMVLKCFQKSFFFMTASVFCLILLGKFLYIPEFTFYLSRSATFPSFDPNKTMVIPHRTPLLCPFNANMKPTSFKEPMLRGNWGDWLWKFAAYILLDPKKNLICTMDRETCKMEYPHITNFVHYHPFANDLTQKSQTHNGYRKQLNDITAILNNHPDQYLSIGIGTQGEYSKISAKRDLGRGYSIEIRPEEIILDESGKRYLTALQRRKQKSFFRGKFTNEVAINHGYHYGIEAGCPTLLINPTPNLGLVLQEKYQKISRRIGDKSLKIALNSSPRHPNVRAFCAKIMNIYKNSVLFVQERIEVEQFEAFGFPFERLRIFEGNITSWLDSFKDMDLSFGPRIHGNMAALASTSNVPAFVVTPDHRVEELAELMMIPHTDIYDGRFLSNSFDIAELIRDTKFNGEMFDHNRCRLAKIYVKEFHRLGMQIAAHVENIANQC